MDGGDIEFINFDTSGTDKEITNRSKRNVVISNSTSRIVISDNGLGMSFSQIKDDWMEIGLAQLRFDIRIAGVGFFGSFVMRFDPAHRGAFVLGKAQNCMLCFHN